jgi:hypothetical protein
MPRFRYSAGRGRDHLRRDLLPNELASDIAGMIEQGMSVMKKTLEASLTPSVSAG